VDVEGNCVKDAKSLCKSQCGDDGTGEGGTVVEGTGLCQCSVVQDVDAVCDAECRASAIKVTLQPDGKMIMYDPIAKKKVADVDPT
jgi:hypothetical protein